MAWDPMTMTSFLPGDLGGGADRVLELLAAHQTTLLSRFWRSPSGSRPPMGVT